jgi:hypothetical protein
MSSTQPRFLATAGWGGPGVGMLRPRCKHQDGTAERSQLARKLRKTLELPQRLTAARAITPKACWDGQQGGVVSAAWSYRPSSAGTPCREGCVEKRGQGQLRYGHAGPCPSESTEAKCSSRCSMSRTNAREWPHVEIEWQQKGSKNRDGVAVCVHTSWRPNGGDCFKSRVNATAAIASNRITHPSASLGACSNIDAKNLADR